MESETVRRGYYDTTIFCGEVEPWSLNARRLVQSGPKGGKAAAPNLKGGSFVLSSLSFIEDGPATGRVSRVSTAGVDIFGVHCLLQGIDASYLIKMFMFCFFRFHICIRSTDNSELARYFRLRYLCWNRNTTAKNTYSRSTDTADAEGEDQPAASLVSKPLFRVSRVSENDANPSGR